MAAQSKHLYSCLPPVLGFRCCHGHLEIPEAFAALSLAVLRPTKKHREWMTVFGV
jgi:hypothetical protein